MANDIPEQTISAFARSIHQESLKYGFSQVDVIRLINALMDLSADSQPQRPAVPGQAEKSSSMSVKRFPLQSDRLSIRTAIPENDIALLEEWMEDEYGRHFLLSCATAQQPDIAALIANPDNEVGVIELDSGEAIGAVAYLDIDKVQRRAELRKLIGAQSARGKGFAEEATSLWIEYGMQRLKLEKIYVSTLQTHLSNIKLNESVGFRVEGLLRAEVRLNGERHDVLRMGLTR